MPSLCRCALPGLLLLAGCFSFRPLSESFERRPIPDAPLAALRPARIDVEASSLTLEARPDLKLKTDILRVELADALNTALGDGSAGQGGAQHSRFQIKLVATEHNNAGMVVLAPLTLIWAIMLPYVNVSVRLELVLQVGENRYASVGIGDEDVSAAGPKVVADALQSAIGLALNDALGKLQPASVQVTAVVPR